MTETKDAVDNAVSPNDRFYLLLSSLFVGVFVAIASVQFIGGYGVFIGFAAAALHPIIGTFVAKLCEFLAIKSHATGHWKSSSLVMVAAGWPFALAYWLIVFAPTAIINRLYNK